MSIGEVILTSENDLATIHCLSVGTNREGWVLVHVCMHICMLGLYKLDIFPSSRYEDNSYRYLLARPLLEDRRKLSVFLLTQQ